MCERARGDDERCGGQWHAELLGQHRGEKNEVSVLDEELKCFAHAGNNTRYAQTELSCWSDYVYKNQDVK
jgi:hypothetical protein